MLKTYYGDAKTASETNSFLKDSITPCVETTGNRLTNHPNPVILDKIFNEEIKRRPIGPKEQKKNIAFFARKFYKFLTGI